MPGPSRVRGRATRPRAARGAGIGPTGFFATVYAAVSAIPPGRVATYGEIAHLLGVARGARAVGWALRALTAPLDRVVPWHRVVGQGGRISLRAGLGPQIQRRRLRAEGVLFRDGRVDLERHSIMRAGRPRPDGRTRRRAARPPVRRG